MEAIIDRIKNLFYLKDPLPEHELDEALRSILSELSKDSEIKTIYKARRYLQDALSLLNSELL